MKMEPNLCVFVRLVAWLLGCSVAWLLGCLVCWFVGLLVCWFVGLLVCLLAFLLACLFVLRVSFSGELKGKPTGNETICWVAHFGAHTPSAFAEVLAQAVASYAPSMRGRRLLDRGPADGM